MSVALPVTQSCLVSHTLAAMHVVDRGCAPGIKRAIFEALKDANEW